MNSPVLQTRDNVLRENDMRVLRVFDTFEHSGGEKDVCLCETSTGDRRILRIGEARPDWFFPEGYEGTALRIPRVFSRSQTGPPYEIEEYIEGPFVHETSTPIETLMDVFWEFQRVASSLPFEKINVREKIDKHLEKAVALCDDDQAVRRHVEKHAEFWEGAFPSKWKFALDNLIVASDGKIVFIDNARVGHRFFAYDLGWLIWPRWLTLSTEAYRSPSEEIEYFEKFLDIFQQRKPEGTAPGVDLVQAFWLTVFERCIGSLYDLANDTRHLGNLGLLSNGDPERRGAHQSFLNMICREAMNRT